MQILKRITGNRASRKHLLSGGIGIVCTLLMTVIMLAATGLTASAAGNDTKVIRKNDDFKVSAEYGIGGFTLYDCPIQASVTIESSKNFTGILQIRQEPGYGETVTAYGKRITLAAGEKKTYKLTIAPPSSYDGVRLAICNEKEKPIYEEKTALNMISRGDNAMVGVLSDDYTGISYFNGASMVDGYGNYTTVNTIEFTKDSFPEDGQLLSILNCLIIDDFDTSSLSEAQYSAIRQWVAEGGKLILSLGSHYQNVLSGFKDDFVSGTINGLDKKELHWKSRGQDIEVDDVECLDFVLDDGEKLSLYSDTGAAWQKSFGMGDVIVLSYSLSMEPVSNAVQKKDIAAIVLEEAYGGGGYSVQYNSIDNMVDGNSNLTNMSDAAKHPSAALYGLLLTLYVVFVGPVLYLILKKSNKREKIWVAIPLTSIVFTGIIYCTSFIYRINKPMLNSFSFIQLSENGAKERVYSQVICPSAKKYHIGINGAYTGFKNNYYQYNYSLFGDNSGSDDGRYDCMYLDSGDEKELILNSDSTFDQYRFSMSRVIDEGIGEITLDLDCKRNDFSGTVTNNTAYDLKDVVVTYEAMFYQAGDLKSGETAEIDPSKIITSSGYGVFDNLYVYGSGTTEREKLYEIDRNMESNVVDITKYNHGYVWGTVLSYDPELTADGQQVKTSGTAVLFDTYYQKYSDVTGNYYSTIVPMIVDSQGDYDSENWVLFGDEVNITYSFEGYGNIDTLTIINDSISNGSYAYCEAFNMDTGDYEPVFDGTDELTGVQLEKYLSHGILKLKFSRNTDVYAGMNYDECYIPRIAASGK